MTDTHCRCRVIAWIAAIVLAAAQVVAAAPAGHLACSAAHHGCASIAVTGPCCCGHDSQASRPMGPAPLRFSSVSLRASITAAAVSTQPTALSAAAVYTPLAAAIARGIPILLTNLRL